MAEKFNLDNAIRKIPNFPKEGILFYDITSIMLNTEAFKFVIDEFCEEIRKKGNVTKIAALESRGFIFAGAVAKELGIPMVLIRKKGKLPGETYSEKYALEYGEAEIEVHKSDIDKTDKVVIIDDLAATGGTLEATEKLVFKAGASVVESLCVIGLPLLGFNEKTNKPVKTLIDYKTKE